MSKLLYISEKWQFDRKGDFLFQEKGMISCILENNPLLLQYTLLRNMQRILTLFVVFLYLLPSVCQEGSDNPNYGYKAYAYGRTLEIKPNYTKLFNLYQQGQKDNYICQSLLLCGNNFYLDGDYAEAIKAYTQGIQVADRAGDQDAKVHYAYGIANIYVIFRDYQRAIDYYKQAIKTSSGKKLNNTKALCYVYLTTCYCRLNDEKSAMDYMEKVKAYPVDDRIIAKYYYNYNLGLITVLRGDKKTALRLLKTALQTTVECHLKAGMGSSAANDIGRVFHLLNQPDSAVCYYQLGLKLARADHAVDEESRSCLALVELFKMMNRPDSVTKYLSLNQQLQTGPLDAQRFYASQSKLRNYENGVVERQMNSLKDCIAWLVGIVVVIAAFFLFGMYYHSKLKHAYSMLVKKNRDLIAQREINRKLEAENTQLRSSFELSEEQKNKLSKQILEVFERPDLFCNPDFSLNRLAELIGSNAKYVSLVINKQYGRSFKSMLNEYRIQIASKRLIDPDFSPYTIDAIAKSVGYTSINSFINAFKRIVGMPPSLYRKVAAEEG